MEKVEAHRIDPNFYIGKYISYDSLDGEEHAHATIRVDEVKVKRNEIGSILIISSYTKIVSNKIVTEVKTKRCFELNHLKDDFIVFEQGSDFKDKIEKYKERLFISMLDGAPIPRGCLVGLRRTMVENDYTDEVLEELLQKDIINKEWAAAKETKRDWKTL